MLCRSFVGYGLLGLSLAILTNNYDNCLIKSRIALACLAFIRPCYVIMPIIGQVYKGALGFCNTDASVI